MLLIKCLCHFGSNPWDRRPARLPGGTKSSVTLEARLHQELASFFYSGWVNRYLGLSVCAAATFPFPLYRSRHGRVCTSLGAKNSMKLFIKGSGGLDLIMVRITAPRQATVYHKVVEQIACECVNTDRGRGGAGGTPAVVK